MSSTRQVVWWSLERKCLFRCGDDWRRPNKETLWQLAIARMAASAQREGRIVDGVCVTGCTKEWDNAGNVHDVPRSGFQVDVRLGPVGGLAALATCRECEANVATRFDVDVAGCFGRLDIWPESEKLDRQLWGIIERRKMEERLRLAFPVTTPVWYGLWINSPLRRLQAEFLYELLGAACDDDDPRDQEARHFLKALESAIRWELPVHVSLAPLGRGSLGWLAIFPHCPRCKAHVPAGRRNEGNLTELHACHVCGHSFNPDENQSGEPLVHDREAWLLEKRLGARGYEAFVRAFLLHRGCSPEQADEVIDNKNNGPLLRRIKTVRQRRRVTMKRLRESATLPSTDSPTKTLAITLADEIDLEFVLIPPGEFLMGSPDAEEESNEAPQHLVRIARPFYLGRFPVTQAQWIAVMGKNISKHRGDPSLPVDQVSWFGAQEFCDRLCAKHGRVFRLPSEAEWEYACRAGTTTQYAFGDSLHPTQANFTSSIALLGPLVSTAENMLREMELGTEAAAVPGAPESKTTPVGGYPPNVWGVFDMHGNVEEWCEDVWHPNYEGAPTDGSAWLVGEDKEPFRVVRGGSAAGTEFVCTSSARNQLRADAGAPGDEDENSDDDDGRFMAAVFDMLHTPCGFRVVCERP